MLTNGRVPYTHPYTKHIMTSDHIPVIFTVNSGRNGSIIEPDHFCLKTNLNHFRATLDKKLESLKKHTITGITDIDEVVDLFTYNTVKAYEEATTKIKIHRGSGLVHSQLIKNIISKRNYYRRRYSRTQLTMQRINLNILN